MSDSKKSGRLYYLDSLKYIFCLIIFWTHFTGVFWTMCEVKPDLRFELQKLFFPPFSILVDSNLALYGFCILSGYLASFKKISSFKELIQQLLGRYIRFVIPFFFINLISFIIYYTAGFPTQTASRLLHNTWIGTYYAQAPGVMDVITASFSMSGELNGPLWMMKYIFFGTCLIYLYNYLCFRIRVFNRNSAIHFFLNAGFTVFLFISFLYPPEPNFFHLDLVLSGVILVKLNRRIGTGSESTLRNIIFLAVALIPVFLDAGGLVEGITPFIRHNYPQLESYFIWNMYWVIGFSFFLILGIMNCSYIQRLLMAKPLQLLARTNFSVYLIHFPLIACFSLRMYILMVNRISYSKEFIILSVATFTALFALAELYELTVGKLQNNLIRKLLMLLSKAF
ncbi:acyltransferase family protein [Oribacterium sp. WCC10]|uniref:acyltransferase family protein n=1 Tax=Oribacterium sp. WCC10 TaxID=1855343 RepID=UPI0008F28699|nr:acyltransferase family protein [Oribacterium sp. WCC10]SFG40044.1 Peptidoglycan/LPS O-acetylase OafA/YrhL, contains acyltransferase and SGNH-hydrolase domains [Oribacterium sp. WCC10]